MLYSSCPTCGFFLAGNVTKIFEDGKEKICNNPDLDEEEIQKQITELIMSLKIRRYCCRMRLMTYKDIVKDIVAPNDDI